MVDRSQSLVLVTLLGTRIFPNPSVYDVVMDLRAETVPFLGGEAHSGMVIGMRNILDKSFTVLRDTVEDNPGYSILVVGYSLGTNFVRRESGYRFRDAYEGQTDFYGQTEKSVFFSPQDDNFKIQYFYISNLFV